MAVQVRKVQASRFQKSHKGYNMPEVKLGQDIFVLQDELSGLMFTYAYLNQEIAFKVARKFPENLTTQDLSANFKPDYKVVTGRTTL